MYSWLGFTTKNLTTFRTLKPRGRQRGRMEKFEGANGLLEIERSFDLQGQFPADTISGFPSEKLQYFRVQR